MRRHRLDVKKHVACAAMTQQSNIGVMLFNCAACVIKTRMAGKVQQ